MLELKPIGLSESDRTGEPLVGMIEPSKIIREGGKKVDSIIKTIDSANR